MSLPENREFFKRGTDLERDSRRACLPEEKKKIWLWGVMLVEDDAGVRTLLKKIIERNERLLK